MRNGPTIMFEFRMLRGLVLQALSMAFASIILVSCSGSEPPPPPESSSMAAASAAKKKKDAEKAEADPEPEVEKTATETKEPVVTAAFLGADIGDEDTKKAATECIKKKNFFDRAGAAPGKCTTLKLSDGECTVDALKATFSTDENKKAFSDLLATPKYAGFLVDQCIDCKGSSDALCQNSGGAVNGLKILFVKEDAEAIKLQYMIKQ